MKKVVTFGETMVRLGAPGRQRLEQAGQLEVRFGGSESNVAVNLRQLGVDTSFVSRVPDNLWGKRLHAEMRRFGVTPAFSWGGNRMGVYYVEHGEAFRGGNVIYDREYSSMAQLGHGEIQWGELFENADWFHWSGITPALSQSAADATREALEHATTAGVTISVDMNYRSKLWTYEKPSSVMPGLLEYAHVIFANLEACNVFLQWEETENKRLIERLRERFPKATTIATSYRTQADATIATIGGYLFTNRYFESEPYKVNRIVDRFGAGDAFMAGLIQGLIAEKDSQRVIEQAAAACAFKHTIPGDINLCSLAELDQLVAGKLTGKLNR